MDISAILLRIEELLQERKMKKEDFYSAVPITDAAISQWRTGKTKPSKKKICRIAEVLGSTPEYIEYGIKKAPTLSGEDSIFADKFSQLDEADKAYISGQIDALLSKRG